MNNLPPEILQNIFTFLTLGERVKCLTVCRNWWNVLDKYCLFYNMKIDNNVDHFKKLMTVMKQSPQYAAQVKELELVSSLPSDFNKRKLCSVFPNVRIFTVEYVYGINNRVRHFKEPLAITQSASKIQNLTIGGFCELASQMVYSNLCGHPEKF